MMIAAAVLLLAACAKDAPTGLKVEGRTDPEGIGTLQPRFSWISPVSQEAYRIQVADSRKGFGHRRSRVWDSGAVESGESVMVPFGGPELGFETDCYWRVRVKGEGGRSAWSAPAHFSTGLDSTAWGGAQWIGKDENVGDNVTKLAARYLRREFSLRSKVESAKLYFCGLGMGLVTVNGERVCEDVYAHPSTLFKATVYYRTYDVTDLLKKGTNSLGVILGCGRYQTTSVWYLRCVTDPRMKLCLKVRYKDGGEESFVSDSSWMVTSDGPIVSNNEFDGEKYDARRELGRWDVKGYKMSDSWVKADVMEDPAGRMLAVPVDDIAVQDEIVPVSIKAMDDGRCIVDMGQNMAGYLKVRLQGRKDVPVVMKFAEHLTADGSTVDMANLRDAEATDIYTPARNGGFEWEPLFTTHGFRFVEISGLARNPETSDIVGKVAYDKMETLGSFRCSDDRLNRLYSNMFCGIRSNYRGMPVDCPQRDERQGWMGDRGATVWSEPYVFGCDRLYSKWMKDIFDSMHKKGRISIVSPRNWTIYNNDIASSEVFLYIADMLYTRFGDDSGIVTYYPAMKKWFDHVTEMNLHDGIFTMKHDEYCDWCCPPESPEIIHSKDPVRLTDSEVIHTGLLCDAIGYMIKFARYTGNDADVPAYEQMLAEVRQAYNDKFFDGWTARYSNNTMTANLVPLAMGIVPDGREADVVANIVDVIENTYGGHLCVGNVGIRFLMQSLTHNGHAELAYRLATQDTYPGWGYMIKKGATTVWELWNGDTAEASMNSENHVMMIGDLLAWYFEDLAGIRCAADAVSFDKVEMEPCFPEELEWVSASHKSPYGVISSEWHRDGDSLDWSIVLPVHTTAVVRVPAAFRVDVAGLDASEEGGMTVITLGPGRHRLLSVR